MTISILSDAQDGSDGTWLDQLGQTGNWKHTITYPGGDASATFDFAADPQFQSAALVPGRIIRAYSGATLVWQGRLEEPQRASSPNPWSVAATGFAALAKEHIIVSNTGVLNDAVDEAITNGLPWKRPASLTNPKTPLARFSDLDAGALALVLADNSYWVLDRYSNISTVATPPTGVTLLAYIPRLPPRTMTSYYNTVVVEYLAVGGGTANTTVLGAATEINIRGRVETFLDLTTTGVLLTLAQAQSAGAALLADASQPTWSAPFVMQQGQLMSIGGVAIDVSTVRPGQVMRVLSLHADDIGQQAVDVPIGQVDYDDSVQAVTLTPTASAKNNLSDVIAKLGLA